MARKLSRRAFAAGAAAATASFGFAPAVAQGVPFKIGLLTVKTGPLAQGGIQMEQGIVSFLKEKGNTLAGRKIEFISADTGGHPAGAKTKAQELIERDKVNAILGPLAAFATNEGYSLKPDSHAPFHGYYFHMLTRQGTHAPGGAKDYVVSGKMTGGFAFVTYPAEYRNSGVMTFMINQDGVLLQKDLGKTTKETAAAMTEFDPDATWSQVAD